MRQRDARRTLKPEIRVKDGREKYHLEATLEFIAPMFGGGVRLNSDNPHLKEPDVITPVRGASLRGQLREWWRRACCDGMDPAEMQKREKVLWGWASTPKDPARGLVSLAVDTHELKPKPVTVYDCQPNRERTKWYARPQGGLAELAYGAFPIKGKDGQPSRFESGTLTQWLGTFEVHVMLDAERAGGGDLGKLWAEVEKTWRAFVTFGGLGGRTRRGFGAVRVVGEGAMSLDQALETLGWQNRCARSKGTFTTADAAHARVLERLRSFRQGTADPGRARNPGTDDPKVPGRSLWPEADELRKVIGPTDPKHAVPTVVVHKFPRAAFGMPIIFHFQSRLDPKESTLHPAGAERLASPLVLRPVRDPRGAIHAVALRLPGSARLEGVLKALQLGDRPATVSGLLTPKEQDAINPLRHHRSAPAAGVDAVFLPFFNHFES